MKEEISELNNIEWRIKSAEIEGRPFFKKKQENYSYLFIWILLFIWFFLGIYFVYLYRNELITETRPIFKLILERIFNT